MFVGKCVQCDVHVSAERVFAVNVHGCKLRKISM